MSHMAINGNFPNQKEIKFTVAKLASYIFAGPPVNPPVAPSHVGLNHLVTLPGMLPNDLQVAIGNALISLGMGHMANQVFVGPPPGGAVEILPVVEEHGGQMVGQAAPSVAIDGNGGLLVEVEEELLEGDAFDFDEEDYEDEVEVPQNEQVAGMEPPKPIFEEVLDWAAEDPAA